MENTEFQDFEVNKIEETILSELNGTTNENTTEQVSESDNTNNIRIDVVNNNDSNNDVISNEQPKRKRGRPKKSDQNTDAKKSEPKEPKETNVEGIISDLNTSITDEYEEIKPNVETEAIKEHKVVISGHIILLILNFIFPALSAKIVSMVSGKKVTFSEVQLTDDEMKDLEKAADEVAKMIFNKLSPVSQLLIGFGAISITKAMIVAKAKK